MSDSLNPYQAPSACVDSEPEATGQSLREWLTFMACLVLAGLVAYPCAMWLMHLAWADG